MKRALVIALCSGCSLVMTKGPSGDPRAYPSCTTSITWPIVDVVFSVAFTSALVGAATEDDQMSNLDEGKANKASKITTSALLTGLSVVGAVVGFRRVGACRDAEDRFTRANPVQPYGYPYQQPYYPAYQPPPQQAAPPAPPPVVPQQQPPASALGTEGDSCSSNADCATGLGCSSNVCVRPPASDPRRP